MNILMLMMGGSGTRLGADIPKQFLEVEGKPIFRYIVEGYSKMPQIDLICLVSHANWVDFVKEKIEDIPFQCQVVIAEGGDTRSASVRNGLLAVKELSSEKDVVLIHDATHPYVDREGTLRVIEAVKKVGGATLGACQYDTCYQLDGEKRIAKVIPRQELVSGASPEAFRYGDISRIYFESTKDKLDHATSAGAIALAHGIPMEVIPAHTLNLKITYPDDLELFKLLVHSYFFKLN